MLTLYCNLNVDDNLESEGQMKALCNVLRYGSLTNIPRVDVVIVSPNL